MNLCGVVPGGGWCVPCVFEGMVACGQPNQPTSKQQTTTTTTTTTQQTNKQQTDDGRRTTDGTDDGRTNGRTDGRTTNGRDRKRGTGGFSIWAGRGRFPGVNFGTDGSRRKGVLRKKGVIWKRVCGVNKHRKGFGERLHWKGFIKRGFSVDRV